MHSHRDFDVFERGNQLLHGNILNGYSKGIEQLLFGIQNQCFIEGTTLNYLMFYKTLNRFRELLETIGEFLIPSVGHRVLFDEVAEDFAVCININEVLGNNVLNTLYSPQHHGNIPVIHLLINNKYTWNIYSKNHMMNTGFSITSLEQGSNIPIIKYRGWPVYYLSTNALGIKYYSLANKIVNLDETAKKSLDTGDKMHYQEGIEAIVTELRNQTEDFESSNHRKIKIIIQELLTDIKIPEERKGTYEHIKDSQNPELCSKCKIRLGTLKICERCDNVCHVCAIGSKHNGNRCVFCQGLINIPREANFKCEKCRKGFTHNKMHMFECECLFCELCFVSEIDGREDIKKCKKHYSHNIAPVYTSSKTGKCQCGGYGKYKLCNKCPSFCEKCSVKCKENASCCISCSNKLELQHNKYDIRCESCSMLFKIEATSNLSCGCVFCSKCLTKTEKTLLNEYKCGKCSKKAN